MSNKLRQWQILIDGIDDSKIECIWSPKDKKHKWRVNCLTRF
jgi:hypothetical protein